MSFRCSAAGCEKSFSNASHLRRHSRNHQEVWLQCRYCEKKFTRNDVLRRHETLHHRPDTPRGNTLKRSSLAPPPLPDPPSVNIDSAFNNAEPWASHAAHMLQEVVQVGQAQPSTDFQLDPSTKDDIDWQKWVDEIFVDGNSLWLDSLKSPLPGVTSVQLFSVASPVDKDVLSQQLLSSLSSYLPEVHLHIDIDLNSVTEALSQYWSEVDPEYPVLHRATYRPSIASPVLNACLFAYGDILRGNRQRSAMMVPVLRCAVIALSTITAAQQTTFLTAALLLSLAGQALGSEQRDHAQALIGYSLTLARRANLYDERWAERISNETENLEDKWRHWIMQQQLRRVSWAILIRDIEYASFHYQLPSRAASPFRLGIDLPCNEETWIADSAEKWAKLYQPSSTPLAGALHSWVTGPTSVSSTHQTIGQYAQLVYVYGLCALGWDMNKRDLLSADVSKCATAPDINKFLKSTFNGFQTSARVAQSGRAIAVRVVAFLAWLDLHISCQDLQVVAGVSSIGNLQPVRPLDLISAERSVREWSHGRCEEEVRNSLELIFDSAESGCCSYNHALAGYMAFLSIWAVYINRRSTNELPDGAHTTGFNVTARILDWLNAPILDIKNEIQLLATTVLHMLMVRPEEDRKRVTRWSINGQFKAPVD